MIKPQLLLFLIYVEETKGGVEGKLQPIYQDNT